MKRNNKKLTLMLAGVLCAATAGAVAAIRPVEAAADTAQTYALKTIFNANESNAVIAGEGEGDARRTAFTFNSGDSVEYDRHIAIKWFEAKDTAKYMTLKFTFKDVNFTNISFTFTSAAMHATEDGYAKNTLTFINKGDYVDVEVNDAFATKMVILKGSQVTLSLGEDADCKLGEYKVKLNAADIGAKFTNIGAKYFDSDSKESLVIKATTSNATVLYLDEINGQSFTKVSSDDKVEDSAVPVLVVNDDITTLLLGAQFKLDYKEIDVLDGSVSDSKFFYQYNLVDEAATYSTKLVPNSATGTYFMDTVIYTDGTNYSKEAKDGYTATTVYKAKGEEYVSIQFTLMDDSHKSVGAKYYLSWYADQVATFGETDYIKLNRNVDGPQYDYTTAELETYEAQLATKAATVFAGSNETMKLPSLEWLFTDVDNGYQSLMFTISYKTPSSSSPSTTSPKAHSDLTLSANEPGWYEFKVIASDPAGNPMRVEKEENGQTKMVEVTTDNVWDLDNVPSFTYEVKAQGIKTKTDEDKDTLDNQILGESYTMGSISIVGVVGQEQADYALYKLDIGAYAGQGQLTVDVLSKVKFADVQREAARLVKIELAKEGMTADKIDYLAINKLAYCTIVAETIRPQDATTVDVASVEKIFLAIDAYNEAIPEDVESDNEFNWNPEAASFTAAESGLYIIVADYWDDEMMYVDHAAAYQLIEVESEVDVIKGETEWLKNNLVSVILFSVAAVMLILIIILLLVKPSDETLEDLDKQVVSKRKAATDKNKKK